jgi:BirA family transcriptional regulator, biotin operon repressor / biotin---[acetyl-CoA-carboxylase] ligase
MAPDKLSVVAVERSLTTRLLGHPALVYPSIGSTNDAALERAAGGATEGLLVLAEEQTAGRGRQDRSWWAPPGSSLLMSLLLRPSIAAASAGQLTMCLGLGAVEGIERLTSLRVGLKWPNDLVLNGRKLGGMLSEARLVGGQIEYAVLGLGLNVNLDVKDGSEQSVVPADVAASATSLQMALGEPVDRLALLAAILERCEKWYMGLLAGESPYSAWLAHLDTLGRRVRVSMAPGTLEGVATGASPEGALLLQDDHGHTHTIWAGDVTAVRPGEAQDR